MNDTRYQINWKGRVQDRGYVKPDALIYAEEREVIPVKVPGQEHSVQFITRLWAFKRTGVSTQWAIFGGFVETHHYELVSAVIVPEVTQ